jgi:hypothetical protein
MAIAIWHPLFFVFIYGASIAAVMKKDSNIRLSYTKCVLSQITAMSLSDFLPTISQLSHQEKIRLIHFLLLAVAKEEGYNLEAINENDSDNALLNQLASTEAVVWSPQADHAAVQALSELLVEAQESASA